MIKLFILKKAIFNWFTCHVGSSCNCTLWENIKEEIDFYKEKEDK